VALLLFSSSSSSNALEARSRVTPTSSETGGPTWSQTGPTPPGGGPGAGAAPPLRYRSCRRHGLELHTAHTHAHTHTHTVYNMNICILLNPFKSDRVSRLETCEWMWLNEEELLTGGSGRSALSMFSIVETAPGTSRDLSLKTLTSSFACRTAAAVVSQVAVWPEETNEGYTVYIHTYIYTVYIYTYICIYKSGM